MQQQTALHVKDHTDFKHWSEWVGWSVVGWGGENGSIGNCSFFRESDFHIVGTN